MEKDHCCSKCVYFGSFIPHEYQLHRFPINDGEKMTVCFFERQANIFDSPHWLHQRLAICKEYKAK